jgi:hypothetical protein
MANAPANDAYDCAILREAAGVIEQRAQPEAFDEWWNATPEKTILVAEGDDAWNLNHCMKAVAKAAWEAASGGTAETPMVCWCADGPLGFCPRHSHAEG